MWSSELARDHLRRAAVRLEALEVLFARESWADVVRESQEIVELSLKGLLLAVGIEPPRVHDVSDVLLEAEERIPKALRSHLTHLAEASRELRRDRELAFYGSADLTPSSFYKKADAERARASARSVVELVTRHSP